MHLGAPLRVHLHSKPKKCCSTCRRLSSWASWSPPLASPGHGQDRCCQRLATLTNLKAVQVFLGFANFYCRSLWVLRHHHSPDSPHPQGHPVTWGPDHTEAFETLKTAFTQAPILAHFNADNPIVVDTDTSDYAITAIISQISPTIGDIHPIMFYSCSMPSSGAHLQDLRQGACLHIRAFRQWRNYLEGSAHVVLRALQSQEPQYFATTKQLMCRQVCGQSTSWVNYLIRYHAGQLGTKPDALTRHEDVYPCGENAYALANPITSIHVKAGQLLCAIVLD